MGEYFAATASGGAENTIFVEHVEIGRLHIHDGYHFSKKSKDVYAPFSLLRALDDNDTYHYWFESGTSSSLLDHLRHFPITRALDYDGVAVSENEFSIPCENADTPMPLLYQSGYLTIASYDRLLQRYELKIPNNEVRKGLIDCLMPIILKRPVADNNSVVAAIAKAVFDGNLSEALTALRSYIAKIPYDIITKADASTGSAQVSRKVTKCGVCISSEQRNITHWRAVDMEGNVIDEQK